MKYNAELWDLGSFIEFRTRDVGDITHDTNKNRKENL